VKITPLIYILLIFLVESCAIIVQPTGGPKDFDPPEILQVHPENQSTHISSPWKIEFVFNEFIVLNNPRNELIISPPLKEFPKYTIKGKKLILSSDEELKENTSYVFQFGNSIKDFTEANVLQDYKYVFSTGAYIDSHSIKGLIYSGIKQKKSSQRIALLHPWACDTCIYKSKPLYFTKADSLKYYIEYLPHDTFELFVLGDKNANYMYDRGEELGFFEDCVISDTALQIPMIPMFIESPKNRILDYGTIFPGAAFLKMINPDSVQIYSAETGNEIYTKRISQDSIYFWTTEKTVLIRISDKITDTISLEESRKPIPALSMQIHFDKSLYETMKITFNQPIQKMCRDSIKIIFDSAEFLDFEIRSTDSSQSCFEFLADFKNDKKYVLIIHDSAFTSVYKMANIKTLKELLPFSEAQLGIIEIVPESAKKEAVFFELYNSKGELLRKIFWEGREKIEFSKLLPGNYTIKAIIDENRNGIWDTGILRIRKQPERMMYYPEEIVLKANWELRDLIFRLD
jgi:hypothetical protein